MKITSLQRDRLKQVTEQTIRYIQTIEQDTEGLELYLVGGAVRDALKGIDINDKDFVVTGETADSMLKRGFSDIGASSYGVLHDENHAEFALARKETKPDPEETSKPSEGYGYKSIQAHTDNIHITDDLTRRDLTINAMAIKLFGDRPTKIKEEKTTQISTEYGDVTFIDLFGGVDDLDSGTIRHVSDAFDEDPIRVLRAARYAARFETHSERQEGTSENVGSKDPFTVAEETKRLMKLTAPELNLMSRPRVGEEVIKSMKQAENPRRFFDVLQETGALAVIAPTLDRGKIVSAGREKYHAEGSVYEHTMFVLTEMHEHCEQEDINGLNRVRRLMMAIAHDLGKVISGDSQGGLWSDDPPQSFPGHAKIGKSEAESLGESLGLPTHITIAMKQASEWHIDIHDLTMFDNQKAINFVDDHTPAPEADTPFMATVEELIDVARADHQGRFQELDQFDHDSEYTPSTDAPEGTAQPVFNAEPFHEYIEAVRTVVKQVDGYTILRANLCHYHDGRPVADRDLAEVMTRCRECQTPGEWVGEKLQQHRDRKLRNLLEQKTTPKI